MSAPSFTPGPWSVDGGHFVMAADGTCITKLGWISPHGLANARLIAAAPELYAALEGALDCLSSFPGVGSEQARASAEAVLAKARGES